VINEDKMLNKEFDTTLGIINLLHVIKQHLATRVLKQVISTIFTMVKVIESVDNKLLVALINTISLLDTLHYKL
jgi:hypothetical protein